MTAHKIARGKGWTSARVGDEIVMMSVAHDSYVGMNEVGARVWELIETPSDIASVCAALVREFEVGPEACDSEVRRFLTDLERLGAIEIEDGGHIAPFGTGDNRPEMIPESQRKEGSQP